MAAKKTSAEDAKKIADRYFDIDGEPKDAEQSAEPLREESPFDKLTDREHKFVHYYLIDPNGTQAAKKAGFGKNKRESAAVAATRMLRKVNVRRAIETGRADLARAANYTAENVINDLKAMRYADIADIYTADGRIRSVHEWPPLFRQGMVKKIKSRVVHEPGDDDSTEVIVEEVEFVDPLRVIKMAGDHVNVGAFRKKVELDVPEDSPLRTLANQLEGTAIRPREPEAADDDAEEE